MAPPRVAAVRVRVSDDHRPGSALGLSGRPAPSNRITLGVIGTGNQGFNDIRSFLSDERVQIVAVCDVNRESPGYWDGKVGGREPARRLVEEHYAKHKPSGNYRGCDACVDFREILGRKDIDAVEVSTPDHWHAIPSIEACKAGKDIYCQKPLALTIVEGRAMSYAVNKHQRGLPDGQPATLGPPLPPRLRAGSQRPDRRSEDRARGPAGRPSRPGEVRGPEEARAGARKASNTTPGSAPRPTRAYAPARCHVNFRWILDYSGGQVTDWGGHHPDCAQWGMGTELTGPIEIRNVKGVFPPIALWNTATDYSFEAVYENGVTMIVSNRECMGVTFEGTKGKIYVEPRRAYEPNPKSILDSRIGPNEIHLYKSDDHFRNFIDCVISRGPTAAPVEVAHRSITICHLGNIAMRLGRKACDGTPGRSRSSVMTRRRRCLAGRTGRPIRWQSSKLSSSPRTYPSEAGKDSRSSLVFRGRQRSLRLAA